jgi:hypothetical protein
MKRIIISQKHIQYLNEENAINISAQASDNSLSSFSKAASSTEAASDIQKAKAMGDVNVLVTGPNTDNNQPTQVIDVSATNTIPKAISDQGNDELARNGGTFLLKGDGIEESYVFTKKALREARLAKIKKEGKTYTKKDIIERFMNN